MSLNTSHGAYERFTKPQCSAITTVTDNYLLYYIQIQCFSSWNDFLLNHNYDSLNNKNGREKSANKQLSEANMLATALRYEQ